MAIYTLREFYDFLGDPSDGRCDEFALGLVLARIVERFPSNSNSLKWHIDQLCEALANHRLELYFDHYGRWVGAVLMKRLDHRGEAAVAAGVEPVDIPHAADGAAWIAYFEVRKAGLLEPLRNAISRGPLSSIEKVAYSRVRKGKRIAKRLELTALDRSCATAKVAEDEFLGRDKGGKQRCEALEMLSRARRLGEWARLSSDNPVYANISLASFVNAATVPLLLAQYIEVRASDDHLDAFLAYGLLTEEGLVRLRKFGPSALSPPCYSEGDVFTAICAGAVARSAELDLSRRAQGLCDVRRREFSGTGLLALEPG